MWKLFPRAPTWTLILLLFDYRPVLHTNRAIPTIPMMSRKKFGFPQAVAVGLGNIIGAGIFVMAARVSAIEDGPSPVVNCI